MLFNSPLYILIFLPLVLLVYFTLNQLRLSRASRACLILASFFFYGYWNPLYLPLLWSSILVNYLFGKMLVKSPRKITLALGVTFNLGLLGYFKYTDFLLWNVNRVLGSEIGLLKIILPLAISFFTFQQIAYLVDAYRARVVETRFSTYCLFVSFFPQLIAGPIVHHSEMMPQFDRGENRFLNFENLSRGLYIFFIGLFKKVVVADTLSVWATNGFDGAGSIGLLAAWGASLSYTFQLYFDFSGYCDMAMGSARMLNIRLPVNFYSPYKAVNVQDFWRRWHMTLSRFLRDYVYIPLGGNRAGRLLTYRNIFLTFFLGGIWHGAGWTFVVWGALHGMAAVVHRIWRLSGRSMSRGLAWFLTFNFVNLCWVFFRARTLDDAWRMLKGMFGLNGAVVPEFLSERLDFLTDLVMRTEAGLDEIKGGAGMLLLLLGLSLVAFLSRNSVERLDSFSPSWKSSMFVMALASMAMLSLNRVSEFLYFQF